MRTSADTLMALLTQVFSIEEAGQLLDLARLDDQGLYQWKRIFHFDEQLPGPGVHNIHRRGANSIGAEGNYQRGDRDIFRPIQYCAVYLQMRDPATIPWLARETIHMAGLHLETLTKRVVGVWTLPLGQLLRIRDSLIERKVGAEASNRLKAFTEVYNDAKHSLNQEKDYHLFTPSDAVIAYFVSRKLALPLWPHAELSTPWVTWKAGRTMEPDDRPWFTKE